MVTTKWAVLVISCLFLCATAGAQITITEGDIPRALGDSGVYKYCMSSATVDVGQTGGPHAWAFDTATYAGYLLPWKNVDKSTAPQNDRFPDANIVMAQSLGQYGFWLYRKLDADAMLDLGAVMKNGDSVAGHVNAPPAINIDLPCTLGSQWSTTYTYPDTMSDTTVMVYLNTYESRIDAWGTGTCPAGTYPVLRQNTFQTEIETYYVRGAVAAADTVLSRRYYWLAADVGALAMAHSMEGDTNSNFTDADDYMVLVQTNLGAVSEQRGIPAPAAARILPNPTTGRAELRLAPGIAGPVTVRVCDAAGRVILQLPVAERNSTVRLDLRGNPAGLYICTVTSDDRVVAEPLVLLE